MTVCFDDLKQINTIKKNNDVILDLAFTNYINNIVFTTCSPLVTKDKPLPSLIINLTLESDTISWTHANVSKFKFRKLNYYDLNEFFKIVNWNIIRKC